MRRRAPGQGVPAIPARGHSPMACERARERVLRSVADGGRDRADRVLGVAQALGGEVHAPTGQVVLRRLAHEVGEAAGQGRARHADLAGQRLDRPRLGGPLVDGVHRAGDHGVAQREQPPVARVVLLQAQPRARAAAELEREQPQRRGEALRVAGHPGWDMEHRRQLRHQRVGDLVVVVVGRAEHAGSGARTLDDDVAVGRAAGVLLELRQRLRVRPSTDDTSSCGVFVGRSTTSPGIRRCGGRPGMRSQHPPATTA